MTNTNTNGGSGSSKVAFSLGGGSKKKRKSKQQQGSVVEEFGSINDSSGNNANSTNPQEECRTEPLVIPLPDAPSHRGLLLISKKNTKVENNGGGLPDKNVTSTTTTTTNGDLDEDKAAARALAVEAAKHYSEKNDAAANSSSGTNFSAKGDLTISSKANTFENSNNRQQQQQQQQDRETDHFRADLDSRPDDIDPNSSAYNKVSIGEFGAALLRGMGWKGNGDKTNSSADDTMSRRPHRLGLGATPAMPSMKRNKNKIRTQDQMKRDEKEEQQQRQYEEQRQERIKQDRQRTLQNGSIVVHTKTGRRARMTQLTGVPGLNNVKIRYERNSPHEDDDGDGEDVIAKKREVTLIDRDELESNPFKDPVNRNRQQNEQHNTSQSKKQKNDRDRHVDDDKIRERDRPYRDNDDRKDRRRHRDDDYDRDSREDRSTRDNRRSESDRKQRRHRDDGDKYDDDRRSRRSRDDNGNDKYSRDKKRRRRDDSERSYNRDKRRPNETNDDDDGVENWLTPNIRVRVISKKLSSRQYKQKGIVMDVTHGGSNATIQMDDRQVFDRVPERYLETALPKVNGNAIVLTGRNKYAKGKLLERNSDMGEGVIQVFEDMSIIKLSLDEIAEWCGPLDDDMME